MARIQSRVLVNEVPGQAMPLTEKEARSRQTLATHHATFSLLNAANMHLGFVVKVIPCKPGGQPRS